MYKYILPLLLVSNVYSYEYQINESGKFQNCFESKNFEINAYESYKNNYVLEGKFIANAVGNCDFNHSRYSKVIIKDLKTGIILDETYLSDLPRHKGEKRFATFRVFFPENTFNNNSKIKLSIKHASETL